MGGSGRTGGARARQRALSRTVAAGFHGLSWVGARSPFAHPERHGVEVVRNVRYSGSGLPEHRLDIYRPLARSGLLPVVFYVHGGGFRALSKDTHWVMGLRFARAGYLVVNIDYRLAPRHPFPAAWQDTALAWCWLLGEVAAWGGDPARIAVAGESAGANLVCALTLMTVVRRPERWAGEVFEAGVVPGAVLPACGILQVSDAERFGRRRPLPFFIRDVIEDIPRSVLPADGTDARLADPLLMMESEPLDRPLPPFFLPVGTRDPILDDTRRMAAAVASRGGVAEARYYPGEVHAFHAMLWRRRARACWRDMLQFLAVHLEPRTPGPRGDDARP